MAEIRHISEKGGKPLTPRQTAAILILAATPRRHEALKILKITRQTHNLWMRNPLFAEALATARTTAFQESLEMIRAAANKASDTLVGLLDSDHEGTRLRAAETLVGFAIKVHETQDIIQRLERLEQQIQSRK